jgi:hypothetical protein
MSTHPGQIEFVDGETNRVLSVDPVSAVPEAQRFVEVGGVAVPVVRVVAVQAGDRRTIRKFGPNGQLLETILQVRSPQAG